jgi:hypothetical protein
MDTRGMNAIIINLTTVSVFAFHDALEAKYDSIDFTRSNLIL